MQKRNSAFKFPDGVLLKTNEEERRSDLGNASGKLMQFFNRYDNGNGWIKLLRLDHLKKQKDIFPSPKNILIAALESRKNILRVKKHERYDEIIILKVFKEFEYELNNYIKHNSK